MENREQESGLDRNKNKYIVNIVRDTAMMKTYVKLYNRVKHPRVTMNLLFAGVVLIALPIAADGIALPGVIISYVMGALLVAMALFRQNIAVYQMKADPKVKENEKLSYLFGNTKIRVENEGKIETMGGYQDVYRVWEDERTYFVGMNEDDLLILPKDAFEKGEAKAFRDYILERTGADFVWKPTGLVNICKNKWMQLQMKMASRREDEERK
ncbi:YcxB family protein [Faecalicatena contorta]|uniref:YcxB family protein n=1 Tax=Faecalicatena contorta TaxID=39482 RepID=UPI001D8EFD91|nr:YcxB family protein [Faecalicatena contorta]MBM6709789.1 YcxB family protein [Faecalicatena contorta]